MPDRPSTPDRPPASALALAGVALAYLALAYLGLALTLPPLRGVGIWPPAGLAVAVVLALGPRAAWGVWVGHALFVLLPSWEAAPELRTGLPMALAIATGSALQALAARWTVVRLVGYPAPLDHVRRYLVFCLLAGPCTAWISPSVGTLTLVAQDLLPASRALDNWWVWWSGDALGVLTLTPLCLLFLGEPRAAWRARRLRVGLPSALALAVTLAAFLAVRTREQARIQGDLARSVQVAHAALEAMLARVEAHPRPWPPSQGSQPPVAVPLAGSGLEGHPDLAVARAQAEGRQAPTASAPLREGGGRKGVHLALVPAPGGAGEPVLVSATGLWLAALGDPAPHQGLHFRWVDATEPGRPQALVEVTGRPGAWLGETGVAPSGSPLRWDLPLAFGLRRHRLEAWPTAARLQELRSTPAWVTLAAGSLLCALLTGWLMTRPGPGTRPRA